MELNDLQRIAQPVARPVLPPQPVEFSARPAASEQVTTFEHLRQGSDAGARRRCVELETRSLPL